LGLFGFLVEADFVRNRGSVPAGTEQGLRQSLVVVQTFHFSTILGINARGAISR
jgi:hypothetical protein